MHLSKNLLIGYSFILSIHFFFAIRKCKTVVKIRVRGENMVITQSLWKNNFKKSMTLHRNNLLADHVFVRLQQPTCEVQLKEKSFCRVVFKDESVMQLLQIRSRLTEQWLTLGSQWISGCWERCHHLKSRKTLNESFFFFSERESWVMIHLSSYKVCCWKMKFETAKITGTQTLLLKEAHFRCLDFFFQYKEKENK